MRHVRGRDPKHMSNVTQDLAHGGTLYTNMILFNNEFCRTILLKLLLFIAILYHSQSSTQDVFRFLVEVIPDLLSYPQ